MEQSETVFHRIVWLVGLAATVLAWWAVVSA